MKDSYIAYPLQDNWKKFTYDHRYLDALASIFHIQSPATAVIELDKTAYLSYSNDALMVPSVKYIFDFIKQTINRVDCTPNHLLAIYLIYSMDFKNLIKSAKNFIVSEECKDSISKFIEVTKHIGDNLDKMLKHSNPIAKEVFDSQITCIVESYAMILYYQNYYIQDHLDRLLRPIQDTYKLFYYLNKFDDGKKIKDIVILPNPHANHADTNVASLFQNNIALIEKQYIGVSKLCCGYCHAYLDINNYGHRGTHGICDKLWSFPWPHKDTKSPLEEKFKNSVKSIKDDTKNLPPQHRKLSFDGEIEKNISLDLGNIKTSLANFKIKSGLIVDPLDIIEYEVKAYLDELTDRIILGLDQMSYQ